MCGRILLVGAAVALASCDRSAESAASNASANEAVAAKKKHSAYCFFKDEETKGWKTSLDKGGNVVVTGKAHVKDPRYKPELGRPELTGTGAEIWPTLIVNTGYASPDNWWDVSLTIPNSAAVENVAVQCGRKTLAQLTVKRGA